MNATSTSSLPAALDPVVAAALEQLRSEMRREVEAKDRIIAAKNQALSAAEATRSPTVAFQDFFLSASG